MPPAGPRRASSLAALVCLCAARGAPRASGQFLPPGTLRAPPPGSSGCSPEQVKDGEKFGLKYTYKMVSEHPPNVAYEEYCAELGGVRVRFNDPCAWAHGQAQLTVAHFDGMCKGATRTIHWHDGADEWGYVSAGRLRTYVASPDGLPWPASNNVLEQHGVWYFPQGWLHGLTCLTPESEGGCVFTIVFRNPVSVPIDNHNFDTTVAQAPDAIAAASLSLRLDVYRKMRPAFAGSGGQPVNAMPGSSPLVTMVAPGVCEPDCPQLPETTAAPAAVQNSVEQTVQMPGGVLLHQIRTAQFPFAETMSQERTELPAGAARPLVWVTNADGLLVVTSGNITVSLQGGLAGSSNPAEAHTAFTERHLGPGDVAYFPVGRAYWFQEATGTKPASAITVFNVGTWRSMEMAEAVSLLPSWAVSSNLHQSRAAPVSHIYTV